MLCDWLPPDFGAVGQYAVGFAQQLAHEGADVVLVGFSSSASSRTQQRLGKGRLRILRLRQRPMDRSGLVRRALWTLSANLILLWGARRELRACHEVRFTGSPAYLIHFVMPVARILGLRTRYRITDFHPECLIAARRQTGWWLRLLSAATNARRRQVDVIEVLGNDQGRRLVASGVSPERVELRRDPSPISIDPDTPPARTPPGLAGLKTVLYSGNWGEAHDHETFMEGFLLFTQLLPGKAGLWLNATGKRVPEVTAALERLRLPFVHTPPVPLQQLPGVLCAADIHLITLDDRFVGYVMPSKVYGCIASGRPVLFVGSADSDVHALCRDQVRPEKYRRVETGDAAGLAYALADLLQLERPDALAGREPMTGIDP
jgi:glycosyltransferase involved in cell wall biosynthesis